MAAIAFWPRGKERSTVDQSVAVLPLANLSGDKSNDYFGEGLAEENTDALSKAGVRVIGRRSAGALAWYETLALWKGAVFCEGLYGRYLRGETADAWTAGLAEGVPGLLRAAAATAERG